MDNSEVVSLLDKDPLSTDLLVSFLWAAATNYKHDTLVRPFPPQYLKGEHKDIELLVTDVSSIPTITDITQGRKPLSAICRKLLEWILKDSRWSLVYHPPSKFSDIMSLTGAASYSVKPQHIFEVVYSADANHKFGQLELLHGKIHAYHGSRVENFHSILHNGLLGHMNKTSLFGEGTYLSSDLIVAMTFSPSGNIWRNSSFSVPISCAAFS
ncbi:protein mono-ADP-ribosyltransferase PARP16-like [Dysidea avara]|uniref:protein mono-ADP-ribosyltransferase PARP16-like n=1 Tax=Dysidea avara TaxID=196820 RepID=UPI00331F4D3B